MREPTKASRPKATQWSKAEIKLAMVEPASQPRKGISPLVLFMLILSLMMVPGILTLVPAFLWLPEDGGEFYVYDRDRPAGATGLALDLRVIASC